MTARDASLFGRYPQNFGYSSRGIVVVVRSACVLLDADSSVCMVNVFSCKVSGGGGSIWVMEEHSI